jgi:hypothetical protein
MAQTLKLRGHNISLNKPVSVDVEDHLGRRIELGLKELLEQLNDFDGFMGKQSTKDNLIDCLYVAHQYNVFTTNERVMFESFMQKRES